MCLFLTNMDEMTETIQHNIAVVSVLELEQKREHAVARHAHNEVTPRLKQINIITIHCMNSESKTNTR